MTVLSLKTLALQSLVKSDSEKILKLYDTEIDETTRKVVTDRLNRLIKKETDHYLIEVEQRSEEVKERTSRLAGNRFFQKTAACTSMTLLTGFHIGIYYILGAADVDPDIRLLWLILTPLSTVIGVGTGVFCAYPVIRGIVGCLTPGVSDITIDIAKL